MYTTKNEISKKENLHFKALNCCGFGTFVDLDYETQGKLGQYFIV